MAPFPANLRPDAKGYDAYETSPERDRLASNDAAVSSSPVSSSPVSIPDLP
jgi:hypothetical protein